MVESRFKFCQLGCNQTQKITPEPYHISGHGKLIKTNFFHNRRRLEDQHSASILDHRRLEREYSAKTPHCVKR
jgi:hypothetical protein